jgi:hypothetical protein
MGTTTHTNYRFKLYKPKWQNQSPCRNCMALKDKKKLEKRR